MSDKPWRELLLLYLSGELSESDRAAFERYISEDDRCRAELDEWIAVIDVVREEAQRRVDVFRPLPASFYLRLEPRRPPSLNGSHPKSMERKTMITAQPLPRRGWTPGQPFTLAAALLAVVVLGLALISWSGRGDSPGPTSEPLASGLDAQRSSPTPLPSVTPVQAVVTELPPTVPPPIVTATMTATPTPVDATQPWPSPSFVPTLDPWAVGVTATPILADFGAPLSPLASITPSQIEPIISSPARLIESIRLPTSDVVRSMAWSPDGQTLAIGGHNGTWLYRSDLLSGAPRLLPQNNGAGTLSVAFSPDSRIVATLDWEQALRLWDVADGALLAELRDSQLWGDLQFSGDGQYLASTNWDQRISLARLSEGVLEKEPLSPPLDLRGYYIYFAPNGTALHAVSTDGEVVILDSETGDEVHRWRWDAGFVSKAALSSDGELLALGSDKQVLVTDAAEGGFQNSMNTLGMVSGLAFSSDGSMLAAAHRSQTIYSLWLMNRDPANTFYTAIMVYDVALVGPVFSPKDNRLAVGTEDGRVLMLELNVE